MLGDLERPEFVRGDFSVLGGELGLVLVDARAEEPLDERRPPGELGQPGGNRRAIRQQAFSLTMEPFCFVGEETPGREKERLLNAG